MAEQDEGQESSEQPPAEPEQQPMMALRLVLVFQVDGQPVRQVPLDMHLPIPPAGEVGTLQLALDGRELARMLVPALVAADGGMHGAASQIATPPGSGTGKGGLILPMGARPRKRTHD